MLAGSIAVTSVAGRILSFAATMLSVSVSLSPLSTVKNVYKTKTTEEISTLPFIFLATSSTCWFCLGLHLKDFVVILSYMFGVITSLIYILIFLFFATKAHKWKLFAGFVVNVLWAIFLVSLTLSKRLDDEEKLRILGYVATGVYISFLASPLIQIPKIIKNKDVTPLSFDLCFLVFWCCTSWSLYGFLVQNDLVLYGTSVLGVIVSLMQLLCHFFYGKFLESLKSLLCCCCRKKMTNVKNEKEKPNEEYFKDDSSVECSSVSSSEGDSFQQISIV